MASFLWSIRVQAMENCGRFVFYNNIYFCLRKTRNKKRSNKQTKKTGHCVTCYVISMVYNSLPGAHRPQLSTNQRARIHSVIVKFRVHYNRPMYLSIPGTGFKLVELGFWILIVIGIPDSLSCIPYSKAQDSRFRIPQTKISDSGMRNPLHSAFQTLRYLWHECS